MVLVEIDILPVL